MAFVQAPETIRASPAEAEAAAVLYTEIQKAEKLGQSSRSWRESQLKGLRAFLEEKEEEICRAIGHDLRKSGFESFYTEVAPVLNACDHMLKNLRKYMETKPAGVPLTLRPAEARVVAEPLGTVLIFSAWNFPLLLALEPLVGALAAGNKAVIKVSEIAPATSAVLAAGLRAPYVDEARVRVVQGGPGMGAALLAHRWDKIFYTGSPRVGRLIMAAAARHLTPVVLELGGKCPVVVDVPTVANLTQVASRVAVCKWGCNSGQACVAPDYALVTPDDDGPRRFVAALAAALESFYSCHPTTSLDLTRIVNASRFDHLLSLLSHPDIQPSVAYTLGEHDRDSLFIAPTILLDPPLDSPIMQEEIFGPILPVFTMPFDQALGFVNSKPKPLALYFFSTDTSLHKVVQEQTSSGALLINDAGVHFFMDSIPFGGVGESGMGSYHGKYSFDAFSHFKPVVIQGTSKDPDLRFPPYTPEKQYILRLLARYKYWEAFKCILSSILKKKKKPASSPLPTTISSPKVLLNSPSS